jgi:hypothetical protein
MARDQDRERVAPVRGAGRARGAGPAGAGRQLGVGDRLAVGDVEQRRPHRLLPRRADRRERQVERAPLAGEVLRELAAKRVEDRRGRTGARVAGPRPPQRGERALVVGFGEQVADRRADGGG